jgi:class 3 adenylate cyclase
MKYPDVRYAWNGDVALAYQVVGDGPIDLLYTDGWCSNLYMMWEGPRYGPFLRGLAQHARLIPMDRRGFGCSDRFSPDDVPPLEVLADDITAVLNAAGSERAVIMGVWQSGFPAAVFAATHPERTAGLVLCSAWPTYSATEETPWLPSAEEWEGPICDDVRANWGTARYVPSYPIDDLDWWVRYSSMAVAPGAFITETRRHARTDLRGVLPSIHVPTLVLQDVEGTEIQDPRSAQFLADRIAGSQLRPIEGGDQLHWYKGADAIVREVGRFMGDLREEARSFDRVLATVLFTDIVDSTATAATMGDAKWRALIAEHDKIAKAIVGRFRGTFVRGTGDGLLATFDGPARGVRCAEALIEAMRPLGVEVRAGLHTGEIEYGGNDLAGIGVHIGARVGSMAGPSEVWVSSTVRDLVVGSGLEFEDAGEHELKGVPDRWHLYRVVS